MQIWAYRELAKIAKCELLTAKFNYKSACCASSLVSEFKKIKHQVMKQETNYEALIFSNTINKKNQSSKTNNKACENCPLRAFSESLQLNIFFKLLEGLNKDASPEIAGDEVKIIPAKNFVHFSVGLFHDHFSDLNPHLFLSAKNFN